MATLLRDNPDEYPQSYNQSASLLHVWNVSTLEWDKWDGVPSGTMTVSGAVSIDQTTPGTTNGVVVNNASVAVTGTFWQATQPVSGTFWQATQPVSGTVTANAGSGTFATKESRSATATTSQVADTDTSTTILAANSNRLGATVANDSSAVLYLRLGTSDASATNYTARLVQHAYFEVPFGYTGAITGIWASDPGDGAARVTELT